MNNERANTVNIATIGTIGFILGAMSTAAIALVDEEFRKRTYKKANNAVNNIVTWSDKIIDRVGKLKKEKHELLKEKVNEELD